MTGPAGVMALVLAETAAGTAGFLFLTPLWREVKRGFFYLTGSIVLLLALGAAGSANAALTSGTDPNGHLAVTLAFALAGATALWLVLMLSGLRTPGRWLGIASVGLAVVMLWAFAETADGSTPLAFFQLLAGAVFTGAVLDGLLLGHWYLTDRKLPRGPINRMTWALIVAVGIEAVAVIVHMANGGTATSASGSVSSTLSPLLTYAGVSSWIAIGMVGTTALIAVFIKATLRGQRPTAVQSATGFFYLAVITAFTAELAAKVKFLP
jgi:hypothetical protein